MKDTTTVWVQWTTYSALGAERVTESLEKMQGTGRIQNLSVHRLLEFDTNRTSVLSVFDYRVDEGRGNRPSDIIDTIEDITWNAYRPRAAGKDSTGLRARVTYRIVGVERA